MIHEVTQAANRAAAIIKWLEASPAAVIHCNYAANINHGFTPPFTQPWDVASGIDRHPDRTEIDFRLQIQGNQKLIPYSHTF